MALRPEHFIGLTVAVSLHVGLAAALTLATPATPPEIRHALGFEMVELNPIDEVVMPSAPPQKIVEPMPLNEPPPKVTEVATVQPVVLPEPEPIIPEIVEAPPEITTVAKAEAVPTEVQPETPSIRNNTRDALTAEQAKALPLMMASIDEEYSPPLSHSRYLHNPKARYPRIAEKRGMEGLVMVNVRVGRDGQPLEVLIHTSSGYGVLDRAALKAVRSWRFEAARRGNTRVEGEVLVPINFELRSL